jgi:hypothetical protein
MENKIVKKIRISLTIVGRGGLMRTLGGGRVGILSSSSKNSFAM